MVDFLIRFADGDKECFLEWPPVNGYDFGADDEREPDQIEPGDREWRCHRHGIHPTPFCPACKVEAKAKCEGD